MNDECFLNKRPTIMCLGKKKRKRKKRRPAKEVCLKERSRICILTEETALNKCNTCKTGVEIAAVMVTVSLVFSQAGPSIRSDDDAKAAHPIHCILTRRPRLTPSLTWCDLKTINKSARFGWVECCLRPQNPYAYQGRERRTATSTFTQLLNSAQNLKPFGLFIFFFFFFLFFRTGI